MKNLDVLILIEPLITIAAIIAIFYYSLKKRRMKSKMRKILQAEKVEENSK